MGPEGAPAAGTALETAAGGALVLRRRSAWEAADAGLLLWRENVVYFLPFFALPFWICAFALRLLPGHLWVSWLILWLLKPLFDRPILHVISARFFQRNAGMGQICRGLGKSLCRGLAGDLLWRRFSPFRAAMLPVRILEHTRRRHIRERRRTLLKGGIGFCFLLTLWGMALEIMLLGGETLFCVIMAELIQAGLLVSLPFSEIAANGEIFLFAGWCANFMLVETLYVCMGFGLYLNSRVEVEGWDIEILFRGFSEKYKSKNSVIAALVLCLVPGLCLPAKGFAAESDAAANANTPVSANKAAPPDDAPLETLRAVLESPDFGGERESWGIRWKFRRQPSQENSGGPSFSAPWMETIPRIFAAALRVILAVFMAALAVFLLRYLFKFGRERAGPGSRPVVQALRKTSEASPSFLLAEARRFFARGDLRRAWGFCAAAAIRSWPVYRGLVFPPHATEYDCVNLVRASGAGPEEARAFAALVNHWTAFAYGGRLPPRESFEEACAFCASFEADNG